MKIAATKKKVLGFTACALVVMLAGCAAEDSNGAAEGPLDKYFNQLYGNALPSAQKQTALDKKREELIAACMQKEGFEYQPYVIPTSESDVPSQSDSVEQNTVEFAEKYGFGLIKYPGIEDSESEASVPKDPNQKYVDSLSESEREAYYETLNGSQPSEEEIALMSEDPNYSYEPAVKGCWQEAQDQVMSADEEFAAVNKAEEDPEFADLWEALRNLDTGYSSADETSSAPEIAKAEAEWAKCYADAGFVAINPAAARQEFSDRYGELYEEGNEVSASQEEEIFAQEVKAAVASVKCDEKTGLQKSIDDYNLQKQKDFVAKYKTKLDALVAKYGQK